MPSCLVYYGTSEGQTKKIADRLAEHLGARGIEVEVVESPSDVDPSEFDAVIVGDSIHLGHHHRHVLKFIERHRAILASRPSAFFSVCLAINSKNEEDRAAARGFVDDMTRKTGWKAEHTAVFAGALQYSKYGLLTRFIMKRIAKAEGASTDTSHDYEYTDWASVTELADTVADELLPRSQADRAASDAS